MTARRVSPVGGSSAAASVAASAPRLPRGPREVRTGRLLAVCHMRPPQQPSPPRRVAFLFHGVGGSSDVFRHQVPVLLRLGFEVVAHDMLGHGQSGTSSRTEDFTFSALRRDALRIFDELAAPDGGNALIGHSYGTSFVTYLCHERARMVSFAIQIAGGGPNPLGTEPGSVFACCACFFVFAGPALRRLVRARLFRAGALPSKADRRLAFSIGAREFKMVMNGQSWPQGDEYFHAEISTPTLLLHGESDRLVSLEEQKWMRQTLGGPVRLVTVPEAGHMLMLEQPDVTNTHLAEFLTSPASLLSAVDGPAAPNASSSQQVSSLPQLRSRRSASLKSLPCGSQLLRFNPD